MEIDWLAPFQLAWQLGLFLFGSIMVLLVIFIAVLVLYGLVRGFVNALRRAKTQSILPKKEETAVAKETKKPTLKPVD